MTSIQGKTTFLLSDLREGDLQSLVESLGPFQLERILGRGRFNCTILIKDTAHEKRLLLMRMEAKLSLNLASYNDKTSPFPIAQSEGLHKIQEIYDKCTELDFVIKPILFKESESYILTIRPFSRFNLGDRILSSSLDLESKLLIVRELVAAVLSLHGAKCWHGDLSCRKIFLSSHLKIFISEFNTIKPFCLQESDQSPYEFYQLWFSHDGVSGEDGAGNGCYLAPERLKFDSPESHEKADLFALGCIIAEIFVKEGIFLSFEDTVKLSYSTDADSYSALLDKCLEPIEDKQIAALVQKLCHRNPNERILLPEDLNAFSIKSESRLKKDLLIKFHVYRNLEILLELQKFDLNLQELESLIQLALTDIDLLLKLHIIQFLTLKLPSTTFYQWSKLSEASGEIFSHLFLPQIDKLNSSFQNLKLAQGLRFGSSKQKDDFFQSILTQNLLQEAVELAETIPVSTNDFWSKIYQLYRACGHENRALEELVWFHASKKTSEQSLAIIYPKYSKIAHEKSKVPFTSRIAFSLDLAKNDIPFHIFYSENANQNNHQYLGKFKPSDNLKFRQRLMASIPFDRAESISDIVQDFEKKVLIMSCTAKLYFWDLSGICLAPRTIKGPFATAKPRSDANIKRILSQDKSLVVLYSDGLLCKYSYEIKMSPKKFELEELNLIATIGPIEDADELYLILETLLIVTKDRKSIYTVSVKDGTAVLLETFDFEIAEIFNDKGMVLVFGSDGTIVLADFIFKSAFILKKLIFTCPAQIELHNFNVVTMQSALCACFSGTAKDYGMFTAIFNIVDDLHPCLFKFWLVDETMNDKTLPEIVLKSDSAGQVSFAAKNYSILTANELVISQNNVLRIIDWNCFTDKNTSSILSPPAYRPTLKLRNKFGEIPEIIEKYSGSMEKIEGSQIFYLKEATSIDSINRLIFAAMKDSICIYC